MKTPEKVKNGLVEAVAEMFWATRYGDIDEMRRVCGMAHTNMADALAHIKHMESQIPRWIPVEERLPEKMKIVLVFKRRTAHFIWSDAMWNIETDWCGEDGWSKNPHNGCFAVTHWMPLPEPPTKEDKK